MTTSIEDLMRSEINPPHKSRERQSKPMVVLGIKVFASSNSQENSEHKSQQHSSGRVPVNLKRNAWSFETWAIDLSGPDMRYVTVPQLLPDIVLYVPMLWPPLEMTVSCTNEIFKNCFKVKALMNSHVGIMCIWILPPASAWGFIWQKTSSVDRAWAEHCPVEKMSCWNMSRWSMSRLGFHFTQMPTVDLGLDWTCLSAKWLPLSVADWWPIGGARIKGQPLAQYRDEITKFGVKEWTKGSHNRTHWRYIRGAIVLGLMTMVMRIIMMIFRVKRSSGHAQSTQLSQIHLKRDSSSSFSIESYTGSHVILQNCGSLVLWSPMSRWNGREDQREQCLILKTILHISVRLRKRAEAGKAVRLLFKSVVPRGNYRPLCPVAHFRIVVVTVA